MNVMKKGSEVRAAGSINELSEENRIHIEIENLVSKTKNLCRFMC